jgi:CRISPR-associated RAMP protein (TIGR02581 family)
MSAAADPAADFHRWNERIRLSGQLVTRTALHVGSGADHDRAGCDLPVLRDAEGFPVIPGSSLKGALRTTVEALLRGAECAGLRTCDPLDERQGPCGAQPRGGQARAAGCCAVCSVFGTRGIASHMRVSDATVCERGAGIPIELREGVALDRDLRTAQAARRYELELVAPGTAFELELFVDNPQSWMLGLILLGLDQLDRGFASLGGFSTRGLGRVAVRYQSLERASAPALLAGEAPQRVEGEALAGELSAWREALAQRARGGQA